MKAGPSALTAYAFGISAADCDVLTGKHAAKPHPPDSEVTPAVSRAVMGAIRQREQLSDDLHGDGSTPMAGIVKHGIFFGIFCGQNDSSWEDVHFFDLI